MMLLKASRAQTTPSVLSLELPRLRSNVPAREVSVGLLRRSHTPRQVCYGVDFVAHPLEAEGTERWCLWGVSLCEILGARA